MENNELQDNSQFLPVVHSIHFYACMTFGWWIFHNAVFPIALGSKVPSSELAAALPIYALNVMAFGCMMLVVTKPLRILASKCGEMLSEVLAKDKKTK